MEPGNRQPFSEYDIAVSAPGFDNVNISGSDMFSGGAKHSECKDVCKGIIHRII